MKIYNTEKRHERDKADGQSDQSAAQKQHRTAAKNNYKMKL